MFPYQTITDNLNHIKENITYLRDRLESIFEDQDDKKYLIILAIETERDILEIIKKELQYGNNC